MVPAWPLVGRAEELSVVVTALEREGSAGIVIAGAGGVGKTSLARAAIDAVGEAGFATVWAAASSALASIPFGAIAHLHGEPQPGSGENRTDLLRRSARDLVAKGNGRPVVLAIDDGHALDSASAAFVQHVAMTLAAQVLVTARADEPMSDAIVALWKDGYVERLELQPLGTRDVNQLLAEVLPGRVDASASARLWELSRGNPLLLRELVVGALESGGLEEIDGRWHWREPFQPSGRIREVIRGRLGRNEAAAVNVLEHVAIGEPITLASLLRLCSPDAVADAERAGLITATDEHGEVVVRCAHPLYQEVVRTGIGLARQRLITRDLANAIETDRPSNRLRCAVWRLESGDESDVATMTEAAHTALALFAFDLAERLARRAVEQGGGLRASLALGDALNRLHRTDAGEAVLAPLAEQATTDQDRVDVAVARYYGFTVAAGFQPRFESVLLDAERRVRDPVLLGFLRAQRATLLAFAGDLGGAISLGTNLGTDDDLAKMRAVVALGTAWTFDGHCDRVVTHARSLLDAGIERASEMQIVLVWIVSQLVGALSTSGRLHESEETLRFAEETLVREHGAAGLEPWLVFARGVLTLMRGRARQAQALLEESCKEGGFVPIAASFLVEAYAMTGDVTHAGEAAEIAELVIPAARVFESNVMRARTWLAAARGQQRLAGDLALEAAEWARQHGHHGVEVFALDDAARLGRSADALPRLRELEHHVEMRRIAPCVEHAAAAAAQDGAALERAARLFEEMGAILRSAEATALAARAHARTGLDARSARCEARARVLLESCDGATPPTMVAIVDRVELSAREREVAILAAQGLTSRTIGERLFLSTRTVEGHLQRAYAKLGATNRAELRPLLRFVGANEEQNR